MTERSIAVHAPVKHRGRQVWVDGTLVGTADNLRALKELLHQAGWDGLDEVDVAELPIIEWHGGGPEVWAPGADHWPPAGLLRPTESG